MNGILGGEIAVKQGSKGSREAAVFSFAIHNPATKNMSENNVFGTNQRFKSSIDLVNTLSQDKFPLFLQRLIQQLDHHKVGLASNDLTIEWNGIFRGRTKPITKCLQTKFFRVAKCHRLLYFYFRTSSLLCTFTRSILNSVRKIRRCYSKGYIPSKSLMN